MGCRHTARQNPRSADQRQMSKAPRSPVPPCTALLFPAPLCTVPRSPVLPYMVLLFPVLPYMALLFPVPPCTVPPSPPVLSGFFVNADVVSISPRILLSVTVTPPSLLFVTEYSAFSPTAALSFD